jgi:hypothetical protein
MPATHFVEQAVCALGPATRVRNLLFSCRALGSLSLPCQLHGLGLETRGSAAAKAN